MKWKAKIFLLLSCKEGDMRNKNKHQDMQDFNSSHKNIPLDGSLWLFFALLLIVGGYTILAGTVWLLTTMM